MTHFSLIQSFIHSHWTRCETYIFCILGYNWCVSNCIRWVCIPFKEVKSSGKTSQRFCRRECRLRLTQRHLIALRVKRQPHTRERTSVHSFIHILMQILRYFWFTWNFMAFSWLCRIRREMMQNCNDNALAWGLMMGDVPRAFPLPRHKWST